MSRAYLISAERIEAERARVHGDPEKFEIERVLRLEERELPKVGIEDVRVRVLAVSIEHNVVHAALADTVNIAQLRGGEMCPGNSFSGEVIEVGERVDLYRPGDIVVFGGTRDVDAYGYPLRIPGYDQPNSLGCFAEETIVHQREIKPAPLESGLDLWQLTSIPLRASTAYHLWRRGRDMFRVKVPGAKLARLNVLGFGGGTSEFFLMLARSEGHRAFYCSGSENRRDALEKIGIEPIDQTAFNRFALPEDVRAFARYVKRRTRGVGVHVVCDMFRGVLFDAGISAMAREGVNVSAGWQLDSTVQYNSAAFSLQQLTIDHVHGETVEGATAAMDLVGEVFRADLHHEIYAFEDLPRALSELHRNQHTGLPVVRVARELPESVLGLVPQCAAG